MRKNLSELEQLIQHKKNKLVGTNIEIVTPTEGMDSATQALWMIHLLSNMYVSHGITKSPKKLRQAIEAQECQPWFAVRDNMPIASAALIKQSDGSVELGRAASLEQGNGIGGLVMLMAALEHLRNSSTPLVAEIRAPKEFEGIPSGEATQRICIRDIGLNVHAIGPFFGHGQPFRHEPFMLATTQDPIKRATIFAGTTAEEVKRVKQRLEPLVSTIAQHVEFRSARENGKHVGWETVATEPFTIQVPSEEGSSSTEHGEGFTLKLVESSPENIGATLACLASDTLLGVDRNMGKNGFPVLLFGHLDRSKLLAPLHLSHVVPAKQRRSLESVHDEILDHQQKDDQHAGVEPSGEITKEEFWSTEIAGGHSDEAFKKAKAEVDKKRWQRNREKNLRK